MVYTYNYTLKSYYCSFYLYSTVMNQMGKLENWSTSDDEIDMGSKTVKCTGYVLSTSCHH